MHRHPRITIPVATLAGAVAVTQVLGRTWGSTPSERRCPFPGDDLVLRPDAATTHAITIDAPPAAVWPWLVQMGYHRGGWYTYPWVDRYVVHQVNPSADHIVAELQDLAVGDTIPDGEPGTAWYDVVDLVPERTLVLHSTTHLPPAWRSPRIGAWVDWTWVFVLEPMDDDRTRLVVRWRGSCGPWWVRALLVALVIPADLVMSRSMLRGIASRAEAEHRRATSAPADAPPTPVGASS